MYILFWFVNLFIFGVCVFLNLCAWNLRDYFTVAGFKYLQEKKERQWNNEPQVPHHSTLTIMNAWSKCSYVTPRPPSKSHYGDVWFVSWHVSPLLKDEKGLFFFPYVTVVSLLPLKIIDSFSVSPTMQSWKSEDFDFFFTSLLIYPRSVRCNRLMYLLSFVCLWPSVFFLANSYWRNRSFYPMWK